MALASTAMPYASLGLSKEEVWFGSNFCSTAEPNYDVGLLFLLCMAHGTLEIEASGCLSAKMRGRRGFSMRFTRFQDIDVSVALPQKGMGSAASPLNCACVLPELCASCLSGKETASAAALLTTGPSTQNLARVVLTSTGVCG